MKPNLHSSFSESVIPSYFIKEQYLAEYFDLIALFRECNRLRFLGHTALTIEKSKTFRLWLASIVSLGEKLRRKMELKNKKNNGEVKNKKNNDEVKLYDPFLNSLKELYAGNALAFSVAVEATKTISDFFEDSGYTKLERTNIKPENAVFEWE